MHHTLSSPNHETPLELLATEVQRAESPGEPLVPEEQLSFLSLSRKDMISTNNTYFLLAFFAENSKNRVQKQGQKEKCTQTKTCFQTTSFALQLKFWQSVWACKGNSTGL